MGSELEPEELLRRVVQEIRNVISCERCMISKFDIETGNYSYLHLESDIEVGRRTPTDLIDEDFAETVYRNHMSINSEDIQSDSFPWHKKLLEAGLRSRLTVPIVHDDICIAHIALYSTRVSAFTKGHEELLASIAAHLASAIRNANLYKESEERNARLELSGEIARAVGSTLEPDEVFRTIAREIQKVIPCERCVVGKVDPGSFRISYMNNETDEKNRAFLEGNTEALWWYEHVYEEKRVFVVSDFGERTDLRARQFTEAGLLSGMIVPILQGDECIAHLSLSRAEENGFTERDEILIKSIAPHLGPAIRNASLYREAEARAARLESVNDIAQAAGSELEPSELFETIIEQIRKVISCNWCVISSFRPETFERRVWMLVSDIEVERAENYDVRKTRYYQRVYNEHLPFRVPDISESSDPRSQTLAAAGFRSNMVVPILQDGECAAHLGVMSTEIGAYSAEDEALLLSVASYLGTAIRNATLYRESEARAARLETTAEIARVVGSELDPDVLFQTIVGEIRKVIPSDRCVIATIDRENDRFQLLYGDDTHGGGGLENLKWETGERSWVMEMYETKQPVIIRDYQEMDSHNARVMTEAGYRSALIIPIVQEGDCIAHMALSRREVDAFITDEAKLLSAISDHIGMAIRNASLLQQSEERAQRMAAFNDLSRKISENLNLSEVLESVGHAAELLLEANSVGIVLVDETSGELIPRVLLGELVKVRESLDRFREGEGAAGYVVRTGESIVVPDVLDWPEFRMKEWARKNGIYSYVGVPLREGMKIIGVIFCLTAGRGAFSSMDEEILRSLSDQAVIAIENARLHEEAQRSRIFFESVVDDNADAIHVADIEGNIIYWNRGSEKLFGYSNDEALGQHFSDLLIPDDQRARWLRSVSDRVTESGVAFHTETQRNRKDGSLVAVSLTLSPVKDAEGNLIAISAIHKDLTGRKHAEEALLEREQRLRTILDTAVDGIITIDERGIVDSINPSAQKLTGYTSAEVVGQNVSMLMPNPFQNEHDSYINNYLKTGIPGILGQAREVPALRKDGTTIPVDLSVTEIWLGKRRLFNGTIRDLTERKRTEKEREEYVERLMTLNRLTQKVGTSLDLDEALEAILESTVQLLNVPYVGVFTRQGEVFALRAFRGRYHTETANRFYRVGEGGVGLTVEKGSSLFVENVPEDPNWKMQKASWDYGIRNFLGVPLKSEGEVIGVLSCLATEPRIYTKGEYELINAFANMAAITIRNAANHSQMKETLDELRRSQEMNIRAEKLSSLGVLAAGAAHEILNPASVILMRAEMIGEDAEEESFESKSANIIVRNVRRIRNICDDLRRFSRDEVPSMEPFDPDEALRFSLELIRHELAPAGIKLDMEVNDVPFVVMGDSSQIQQVFLNLISNARDAMPDGGVLSICSTRSDHAGKDFRELQISDTAMGIPKDVLPQIFDPFFTTKPADKGTGLGLSVLHGIVKSHEGEVSVESQPGEGSTFTVRLPEALEDIGV
ncbi:MAG: GAF domain-containing protein [Nitrospinaceae bacterium]|nr:GAF domain-containing protein [Nitrospinaceae bacterium]